MQIPTVDFQLGAGKMDVDGEEITVYAVKIFIPELQNRQDAMDIIEAIHDKLKELDPELAEEDLERIVLGVPDDENPTIN